MHLLRGYAYYMVLCQMVYFSISRDKSQIVQVPHSIVYNAVASYYL